MSEPGEVQDEAPNRRGYAKGAVRRALDRAGPDAARIALADLVDRKVLIQISLILFTVGTVIAGFTSGDLNAYRYENGRVLWQDALSRTTITTSVSSLADIDASPVIDGGRVYAVGEGGRMVSLDLATGQRLWEQFRDEAKAELLAWWSQQDGR